MEKNQIKISEDEQTELADLNLEFQNILLALGELFVEETALKSKLKELKHSKKKYKSLLNQFKSKENIFSERLSKKYGSGSLDITSGIYLKS